MVAFMIVIEVFCRQSSEFCDADDVKVDLDVVV